MQYLKIFNTLNSKKETCEPIESKHVKIYACGPTVYNYAHIGNARMAVVFDTFVRTLKAMYPKVTYVSNITDIDDKIIEAAKEQEVEISQITDKYTKIYNEDMARLNVLPPDVQPKATEFIPEMINLIEDLISKDFAYEKEGHVLFHVPLYLNYGKLSNKKIDELIAGSRVEVSENKKNPEDFVLWKPSKDKEPHWESPWGKGRPGWHLECSVMSKKYLGDKFDIHGGGRDLIFPHHENEIAQSRSANENQVFANYWIHNGLVTISNEKMAKSVGNILKLNDLKNKINGQVLRLALISAHYKQPLDWNQKLIDQCYNTINKWYESYVELKKPVLIPEEYLNSLWDDLNTPGYIAELHRLFEKSQKGNLKDKEIFVSACNFIGLMNESKDKWLEIKKSNLNLSEKEILHKINERNNARNNKNYKLADKIRDELLDKGVLIEDKNGKTIWKYK